MEGDEVCTPVLVNFFKGIPVVQVSCGDAHVAALTRDSDVYTWGCGEFGKCDPMSQAGLYGAVG